MGLRFRRSVRLFPGVRLNFSRSGVSTSIGVRGATMTLGPRGAYANVGIPGSGLSYRTRLDAPARTHSSAPRHVPSVAVPSLEPRAPIHTHGVASIPGTEVEIKSADVSVLTSSGLGELKQLINDAANHQAELRNELASRKKVLDEAARRLRRAQSFIVRLFTAKAILKLVEAANDASEAREETQSHLNGCFVEVDFAFDDATRSSYASLVSSFEKLRTSQRIWDITATAAVDRVAQRTTASSALTRAPVAFDFTASDIIRSQYRAMRFGTVSGRDLQVFPGFIMMRDAARDFALIEFGQLTCELARSNFIEEEAAPSDAEQVGSTWKRANKDGSRDRRFNDNYQIPVLKYGALAFSSPTGLAEVFQISNHANAAAFAQVIANHKRALANLDSARTETLALPAPAGEAAGDNIEDTAEPAFRAKPRKNLFVDWTVLALALVGLFTGSSWTATHWSQVAAAFTAPSAPPAKAPQTQPQPSPEQRKPHHRHHHRGRHHAKGSDSLTTAAAPSDVPEASQSEANEGT